MACCHLLGDCDALALALLTSGCLFPLGALWRNGCLRVIGALLKHGGLATLGFRSFSLDV